MINELASLMNDNEINSNVSVKSTFEKNLSFILEMKIWSIPLCNLTFLYFGNLPFRFLRIIINLKIRISPLK